MFGHDLKVLIYHSILKYLRRITLCLYKTKDENSKTNNLPNLFLNALVSAIEQLIFGTLFFSLCYREFMQIQAVSLV